MLLLFFEISFSSSGFALFLFEHLISLSLFTWRYLWLSNAIGCATNVIGQRLSVVPASDATDAWWWAVIPEVVEDSAIFSWLRVAGQIVIFLSGGSIHGSSVPQFAVQKWVSGNNVSCPPEFEEIGPLIFQNSLLILWVPWVLGFSQTRLWWLAISSSVPWSGLLTM